jgi:anti-sigma-K factor RskA
VTTIEPRPEMDALLGAYVLDALELDERALVEEYVAGNDQARTEVDDLRETVAVLAATTPVDEPAPAELWQRIDAELGTGEDELASRRARKSSLRPLWIASAAAAVAAAAAIVLAVQVVSLNDDLDEANEPTSENVAKQFDEASETEGAQTVSLDSERGEVQVVLLPDGTGYLLNETLPDLDESETYQLWAFTGTDPEPRIVSAAVLGPDPTAASFQVAGPVQTFALTVEQAGGEPQPTQDPFAVANLS